MIWRRRDPRTLRRDEWLEQRFVLAILPRPGTVPVGSPVGMVHWTLYQVREYVISASPLEDNPLAFPRFRPAYSALLYLPVHGPHNCKFYLPCSIPLALRNA